jgi:hypothetical protein
MKASDPKPAARNRPEPIQISDPAEARANRSYIITPPAPPKVKKHQEATDGEAV